MSVAARHAGAWLVFSMLLVSTPVRAQLLSPGALSRDHQRLEGDTHCGQCHSSGRRVAANLCNECHQSVGRSIRGRRGLHGRQYANQSCGDCHVEHRGRGGTQVRWPGGSADAFDHSLVGWALRGGHRGQECNACHTRRNSRGARTYLGTRTACVTCHDDPHSNRLGRECGSCHTDSRWSEVDVESFDHGRARFPLRGSHERVDCAQCHGSPARYRGIAFSNCSDCHRDTHGGRYGTECSSCHTEAAWSELGAVRQNHPGLRLSGGHSNASCERCHDSGIDRAPSRGTACTSCHRPVHEAELGARCERCHGGIRWVGLPRRIGLLAHTRTDFPLQGAHEDTACSECHSRQQPRNRRYRGVSDDGCAGCHEDPHGGEFADRAGGECAPCHSEDGFAPTTFSPASHASTSFALEGQHSFVACSGCHEDERPRLNWVVDSARECATCHDNPHGDQFASQMAADGGCAQCHSAAGWDRPDVDHSSWPLDGAHDLVTCNACHSPSEEDHVSGRGASYRGLSTECASCHEDEHAGQFRLSEPQQNCQTCHDTSSFGVENFDHEAVANYLLVGRHAEAECSACHVVEALSSGQESVRWRLGYRECRACHADPHEEPSR